ncbi:P-loop containing nucleoside triphosphate hydrolase protein [Protomyces lactucae-debilis]|uniref:Obg-like ATPase 1 n=1 Tax=Protomyces lactucae-debilis TaxID=2754530 RepID=A0A1Y2FEU9_PROLT|nr:P-loop containing nucleoside triphosphate hydrolase protein [Protomyces lactucae-debilis]ORY81355.1 P-loop containing nucleoside triphosphate hydrolase protein [Protomyces lactucae-debilis]
MPPKKVEQPPLLLGRPGNNLKAGIVGLANVGKSTFFQSITKSFLGNPANFPYATIDPEEAKCIVPDERFDWLCELYKPKSKIPANLTIFDIAGLTKGASTGAGLGNAFLSHIRAVDALFQVVRCFDDAEIIHVEGDVDPVRDLQIIHEELVFKDTEWVEKYLENAKKQARVNGPALDKKKREEEVATTEKVLGVLKEGKGVRKSSWSPKEVESINNMQLLTAKPVIYLVNLSEKDYIRQKNKHLAKIKAWVDENAKGDIIIPFSVCFEDRLTQMQDEAAAAEECKKLGTKSMLPKIITTGYSALNLIYYFTAGPDEVRAWTIQKGIKAPAAAGVIHTDFEKTFILGEITPFADLKEYGSEAAAKAAGKTRSQGKEYFMNDGDLAFWKCGKK